MPVRQNQYKDSGSNVGKDSWFQKVTIIFIHQELWYTKAINIVSKINIYYLKKTTFTLSFIYEKTVDFVK